MLKKYFSPSFESMITPDIIRFVFIIGLIANGIVAIGTLISLTIHSGVIGFLGGILLGAIVFAISCILWRIYCELILVLFNINDRLGAIKDTLAPKPAEPESRG
jgi:hypothetical protein